MSMTYRLPVLAAIALGGLLLSSCDPYAGRPPRFGPHTGPGFLPPPQRGDGYRGPQRDRSYEQRNDPYNTQGYDQGGYDSGYNQDGGNYTGNGPNRDPNAGNPPPSPRTSGEYQPPRKEYPTATRTATPDRVLSPYPPYKVINVSGIESGKLAKDPSTGEIFRVP